MRCNFYIGQKVVCINDELEPEEPAPYVVKGETYTVAGFDDYYGMIGIWLEEISHREEIHTEHFIWSSSFDPDDFRPITDISIFYENMTKLKIDDEEYV